MHFRKVHMLDAWCLDNERSNAQETTRPTSQLQKSAPKCGVIKHRTFNVVSTTMVIYHQTLQMDNQDQWKWGGSSHSLEGLSKTNENLRISASQLAFKPGTSWTQVSSNTAQATDMAWNPLQVPRIKINLKKSTTNVTNNESNTHLCYTSIITEHFWRQNYHLYVKKKNKYHVPLYQYCPLQHTEQAKYQLNMHLQFAAITARRGIYNWQGYSTWKAVKALNWHSNSHTQN